MDFEKLASNLQKDQNRLESQVWPYCNPLEIAQEIMDKLETASPVKESWVSDAGYRGEAGSLITFYTLWEIRQPGLHASDKGLTRGPLTKCNDRGRLSQVVLDLVKKYITDDIIKLCLDRYDDNSVSIMGIMASISRADVEYLMRMTPAERAERAERERAKREKIEREIAERERVERERVERERAERAERKRVERERAEREAAERERVEREAREREEKMYQLKKDETLSNFNTAKAKMPNMQTSDEYSDLATEFTNIGLDFKSLPSSFGVQAQIEECENYHKQCEALFRFNEAKAKISTSLTADEYGKLERELASIGTALKSLPDSFGVQAQIEECDNCQTQCYNKRQAKQRSEKTKKLLVKMGKFATVAAVLALIITFIIYRATGSFFKFQQTPYQSSYKTTTITGYSGKKQVVIPATNKGLNVTEIGNKAFYEKKLTSVVIPDGITVIGDHAFYDNRLTSIVIPDSVTYIGDYAFWRTLDKGNKPLDTLTDVTIGNDVTFIGERAFSNNSLTSVTIPKNVTTVGYRAFSYNLLTSVTIPDSVTTIGEGAFRNNQLKSVSIGSGVTSIGNEVFANNPLTSVIIGNSVKTIGKEAFYGNQLTSVAIPNSVTKIEEGVFCIDHKEKTNITSITIGRNVTLTVPLTNVDGSFGASFESAYNNGGKRAGTYTRPNANSTAWTRR
jgi:hypothetical protein